MTGMEQKVQSLLKRTAMDMLGLGAPTKKDDMGFNKPDYSKVIELLPAMYLGNEVDVPNEIWHYLANMMVKYVRQIGEPAYSIIRDYAEEHPTEDSYYGYKALVQYKTLADEARNQVNAEFHGTEIWLTFKYDEQTLNAVKKIPGIRYHAEGHGRGRKHYWIFPAQNIDTAIDTIEGVVGCNELYDIREEHEDELAGLAEIATETPKAATATMEAGKVYCEKVGERIMIRSLYDPKIISAVKVATGYKWHKEEKVWSITVAAAAEVAQALEESGIDASDLMEHVPVFSEEDAEFEEEGILERLEKYPGLFKHQIEGVVFLMREYTAATVGLHGKILADDMGLGKTRQSVIGAFEVLCDAQESDKVLIICPASLKLNWDREIKMVFPFADTFVVNGKGWVEEEIEEATWVIINYDLLKKYEEQIVSRKWAVTIMDEAHYVKNNKAYRSKIALGAKKSAKNPKEHVGVVNVSEKVFMLTGTPVTSKPSDMFNLLKAVGHPLGKNWKFFVQRYCGAVEGRYGWEMTGASNLKELHQRTKNCLLRRTKEECLDLPEKLRRMVPVSVNLVQYNKYWKEYKELIEKEGKLLQAEHLARMIKLRVSASLEKTGSCIEIAEDIVEQGEKVIIFTNFTEVVERLMRHFGDKAVKVVGGMTDKAKQQSVDSFQNDENIRVFVGNIKAAGVGLTLTAATQVIFNDYSFVPSDHLQAEDRAYRIGQKNAVTVTYLTAIDTIDEQVSELLAKKIEIISQIVEGKDVEDNDLLRDLVRMLFGAGAI